MNGKNGNGLKAPPKSAAKTAPGRPFPAGEDPRRGNGPLKGAENAGRPVSAIRAMLRESYAARMGFMSDVIDGAAKIQTSVPVDEVLAVACCPHCGKEALKRKKGTPAFLRIDGLVSASIRDRQAAADHLAKYGMGTTITPTDAAGNTLIDQLLDDVDPRQSGDSDD